MLSFTEPIITAYEFNGVTYNLDLSFDNVLTVTEILQDETLTDVDKTLVGLERLIGENCLRLVEASGLFNAIVNDTIQSDGEETQPVDLEGNPMPAAHKEQYYSFKYDADVIYAGFMQAYGIDLEEQKGKLHWDKFKALLNGMPSDTRFSEIINIRKRPYPTGKGTAKERAELKRLKQELSFPGADFSQTGGG